jgi:hypothetical protein
LWQWPSSRSRLRALQHFNNLAHMMVQGHP